MLAQRIATAVVMLLVLAGALWAPRPEPLLLLFTLGASCAIWEWLRLIQIKARVALLGAMVMFCALGLWFVILTQVPLDVPALDVPTSAGRDDGVSISAAILAWRVDWFVSPALILLATGGWILGAARAVMRPQLQPKTGLWPVTSAYGAVLAACLALAWLYVDFGSTFLLSLMALVWFADIAAYFVGRACGRHKLAPDVSPGKTWEGAAGGVLAAVVWIVLSAQWQGSFGAELAQRYSWMGAALLAALLAALSIVGDLYESLLKRRAGVKDSSGLLPGHGGVLDRIDALLPVAPAAWCLLLLRAT